jgi:hypothetical protein
MSSTNLFSDAFVCFEANVIHPGIITPGVPMDNPTFGILNIQTIKSEPTTNDKDFVFVIDSSGSMSDICSDGKSKMQHIKHTLKNMIRFFHDNQHINVYITIFAFDEKIKNILTRNKVTHDNLLHILTEIDKISPNTCTDIELALKNTSEYVFELRKIAPHSEISHIFMTDGDVTLGETSHSKLSMLVDQTINNAFIGFGIDHNDTLMRSLSNFKNSSYFFVDSIKNTGLIYGEILHDILYKILINIEICVTDGLIYDYKNNSWVNSLQIDSLTGESNKVFHLLSDDTNECRVVVKSKTIDNFDYNINIPIKLTHENLANYIFRQRTLQLLFEVQKFESSGRIQTPSRLPVLGLLNSDDINSNVRTTRPILKPKKSVAQNLIERQNILECQTIVENFDDINTFNPFRNLKQAKATKILLKQKMVGLMDEIKKYASDNGLANDKFLKNLCDDIYISYTTFGTKYSTMYTSARQTSQGSQRHYSANSTPNSRTSTNTDANSSLDLYVSSANSDVSSIFSYRIPPLTLRRPSSNSITFDFADDTFYYKDQDSCSLDYSMLNYEVSNFEDTPYSTHTASQLMHTFNAFNYDNNDDNDDNLCKNIFEKNF